MSGVGLHGRIVLRSPGVVLVATGFLVYALFAHDLDPYHPVNVPDGHGRDL